MSVRKERFCDFMTEEKPGGYGAIKPAEPCISRAIGTCFFCRRDYCSEHKSPSYSDIKVELTGFKNDLRQVLPRCKDCGENRLPYNPDALVLKRFQRLCSAIKRNIRAERKATRAAAEAAREKRKAKADEAEKKRKAKEAVAQPEPEAEVAEATETQL